jgi:hypothetical protein
MSTRSEAAANKYNLPVVRVHRGSLTTKGGHVRNESIMRGTYDPTQAFADLLAESAQALPPDAKPELADRTGTVSPDAKAKAAAEMVINCVFAMYSALSSSIQHNNPHHIFRPSIGPKILYSYRTPIKISRPALYPGSLLFISERPRPAPPPSPSNFLHFHLAHGSS